MQQICWMIALACVLSFSKGVLHGDSTSSLPPSSMEHTSLVDIDGGRKMFLECRGNALPTVVFISGRADRATVWDSSKGKSTVFSEVAKFARACAYDRPGTITITEQETVLPSRSTSVQQPTTAKNGVDDLHALLNAAKVSGPYVLVAHSWGGLIARLYASTYPEEVSGLVLVDTLTEQLYDSLTPQQQAMWVHLNSNYSPEIDQYTIQERTDFLPSFEQMRAAPALRPMPVVILTSDQTYNFKALKAQGILPEDVPLDFEPVVFQAHLRAQQRLAQILHAKQINNTHAGHYIHTEQPQLVVEAIRTVVEQIRKERLQ